MTDTPPQIPGFVSASTQPDFLTQPQSFLGSGALSGNPFQPDPSLYFAENANEAGQFTKDGVANAVATGQKSLSTGSTQPCATCDKTQPYSLAFEIKDGQGNLCNKGTGSKSAGMYYTVKYKLSGESYTGSTDENGLTERYFASNAAETIFLYLGHRTKDDGYPEDQSAASDKYDEAPLANDTVAVIADEKIYKATTRRLWKPWAFSAAAATHTIDNWEKRKPHVYDDRYPNVDWDGKHSAGERLTIGAGHLLPTHAEADNYLTQYPTTGPGMSNADMDQLFQNDVQTKADEPDANSDIKVPLFQREFDAYIDFRFNAGSGASDYTGGFDNADPHAKITSSSLTEFLNRGRYTEAGNRILTTANSAAKKWHKGVQNRRNDQKSIFFGP